MSRIIVSNLPKFVNEKQLKEHFAQIGQITDCRVVRNETGQSRKFGFIGFKDPNASTLAIKKYNSTYIGVSRVKVQIAKTRDQENMKKSTNNNQDQRQKNSSKKASQSKQAKEKEEKFNKFKQIVAQSVKKSWDDLVVPPSAMTNQSNQMPKNKDKNKEAEKGRSQIAEEQIKSKKDKKKQKKIEKQKQNKSTHEVKAIKAPKIADKNKKYLSQPLVVDETRLYITNLPYQITEEQIKKQFDKYGNIKKVKLPIEYDGTTKGYAFVTYEKASQALRAFAETDNKVIFGRIIHVKPAVQDIGEIIKAGKQADFEQKNKELYGDTAEEKTSFKKKKKKEMRQKLNDTTSWNTLFLNPNTILEHMSEKLGLTKSQILLSDQLAPKVALAEAEVVQQTKEWLVNSGLNIDFLKIDRNLCKRSEKVLLVKNLNYRTSESELKQLFDFYGIVEKLLLAPNRAVGIVYYRTKEYAENALQKLQNTKFKNNFIYLEYAPIDMMQEEEVKQAIQKMQQQIVQAAELSKVVYIKNLNFQTADNSLSQFFAKVEEPKSAKIIRDKSGKSMGYGFAEFSSNETALNVVKKLQNQILDGHKLILQISKKMIETQKFEKIKQLKQKIKEKQLESTKLIVKNLAFQASKNDVKQLFKHYGSIKNIKLPKKMDGQHRGFAFVEYQTAQESALAKEALSNSHLYGRKLVIQYQKGTKQN